jgi:hypothetical protein
MEQNEMTYELLKLLTESAIEEIARVNNTTEEVVKLAIETENKVALSQFQKLMLAGYEAAQTVKAA